MASESETKTRTWLFDPRSGEISASVAGRGAMKQAIYKRLQTPRQLCPIYPMNYGSELWQLPGHSNAYVKAVLPMLLRNCLLADERILAIDGFTFSECRERVTCTFCVHTIYGALFEEWTV